MQRNFIQPFQYQQPQYGGIAGNGYFYPVPQQQPQPQGMQLIAVNGIEGAKDFILPPNSSGYFIDSNDPYLYFKEADSQGKCSTKAFLISEIPVEEIKAKPAIDTSNFVTKTDLSALEKKIDSMFQKMAEINKPAAPLNTLL